MELTIDNTLSRRTLLQRAAILLAGMVVAPVITGCPISQKTIQALVDEVGSGLTMILPYIKNVSASIATDITDSFAALSAAVHAWTPGSAIADIEQVVNAFVANMGLIPGWGVYAPLASLVVATVEGIINLLLPKSQPSTLALAPAPRKFAEAAMAQFPNPPKSSKSFRDQWNTLAKQDQSLGGLVLN